MDNHTPEPWSFVPIDSFAGYGKVVDANGIGLMINIPYGGSAPSNETMKRIVACVNACAGIPDDALNDLDGKLNKIKDAIEINRTIALADDAKLAAVTAQRDELLQTVKALQDMCHGAIRVRIDGIIAKCEAQNDER